MDRSATATSLLALALGLLGAVLLTAVPLAVGYAARGSPLPALALLALMGGVWAWRRRAREPTPGAPPPRAPWNPAEASAALLALPEFTLLEAQQATGLEPAHLEPLLDALLERGLLRAETRDEAVVYVTLTRSDP